jgi:CheY-like chemotaxis protein
MNPGILRGKSILLVEENARMRSARDVALRAQGYEVESACDPADARLRWETNRPHLVLLARSEHVQRLAELVEGIKQAHPQQRIAFLPEESMCLCPVFCNGEMVRRGEGMEDFLDRVRALLAEGTQDAEDRG